MARELKTPLATRVRTFGALADATRLSIVDVLALGDHSPGDLAEVLQIGSNLLAHHLRVLEEAGVIRRSRSESDRRRSYVHLVPGSLDGLLSDSLRTAPRVVFVCTHNSARSQIAEALWRSRSRVPSASGGTEPADGVHPGAVAAALRRGLRLADRRPTHISHVLRHGDLVVSVCDSADEKLTRARSEHIHWSVPDPVRIGTDAAFDRAFDDVAGRVERLARAVRPEGAVA